MSGDLDKKIELARSLFRLDRVTEAISILEAEEFEKNAKALLLLGYIYDGTSKARGGVSRNPSKSRACWKKAFELGCPDAARELAGVYYYAQGVKENYDKAEFYWLAAANSGDDLAQFELANFYYDDRPEKIDVAIDLYKGFIKLDEYVGISCLKLGRIYHRGIGVPKNVQEAVRWFNLGVQVVDGNCCMDLAYMYYKGEEVEKDVEKAIGLAETAATTEWLKVEGMEIANLMRRGELG